MNQKPELIVCSNFRVGGIKSYYENILSHLPQEHNFQIKWYLIDYVFDKDAPRPASLPTCAEASVFQYQPEDNIYTAAKRLADLISDAPGVVVANAELELATLHLYRRPNKTIVFVCHDDLYIPVAQKYEFLIDRFVAHNYSYYEILTKLFPSRSKDIFYLPYGVKVRPDIRVANKNQKLGIIIVSRLYETKGVRSLPEINSILVNNNVHVKWTIIGDGPERPYLMEQFANVPDVVFMAPPDNETVTQEIQKNDIFILPSRLDGLPVAMLESMSLGCVPLVAEFNAGIKKVVTPEEGFVLPVGSTALFAEKIIQLNADRETLQKLSVKSRNKIETEYEITSRAISYSKFYFDSLNKKKAVQKKFIKYAGYLDLPFVPDWLRSLVRNTFKK